ncbi:PAS domain-containing sensor histidine kinase [Spirosoma jeollabukense]
MTGKYTSGDQNTPQSPVTIYPFLTNGGEMGALMRAFDWSGTTLGEPASWPQSLRTTLSIVLNSKFPMFLFWGEQHLCFYNDAYRPSLGNEGKHPYALGKPGADVWPETWDFIKPLIDQVLLGRGATWNEDQLLPIYRNGRLEDVYWTFSYSPVTDESGRIAGVFVTCQETTQQVLTRQRLEEGQRQVLTYFEQSPVGIAILSGSDLTFRMVNPFYGELVGRRPDQLVDKPLLKALPELNGQGFDQLLRSVIDTGEPYVAKEVAVNLVRNHELNTIYVDFTYQPQREADTSISGVLVVVTEVTQQVIARQKIEDAEATLRSAIELAELGTWQFDYTTGLIEYSPRLREWHGLEPEEVITPERAYRLVNKTDWPRVRGALAQAGTPGSTGLYDIEYTVVSSPAGQERILHAQGKAYFNELGQAYKIGGTVQDVTAQRQIQLALEQQVQKRTEELESINEELATINEELTVANEKIANVNRGLQETNLHLSRSNQNLEQFAYIASHDLQEPLRKIQQFSDLLKTRYATSEGDELVYLERMQVAASRMSLLIKDLLAFSRISTGQVAQAPVSLADVIQVAQENLSVAIDETNAHIQVTTLPTVPGDASQLSQLFQNLLSNAIKFRRIEPSGAWISPQIQISAHEVVATDLPASVKPVRQADAYYLIKVTDNGIGFEEKYTDRIFQVFQRLHGRNEFAGTGVGLAICQKVVTNHGGAITAIGRPGQGATFCVYLPE